MSAAATSEVPAPVAAAPAVDVPKTVTDRVWRRCTQLADAAVKSSPRIQSLLRRIDAKGCTLAADPVVCEDIFGGAPSIAAYDTSRRLVVLNPSVPSAYMNQKEWTRAITHELIHAYDHCRVVLDPTSCKQNACTEIRAANLSGDCDFGVEFSRLGIPIPFGGHQQKCVKRRALASINMHPSCVGSDTKKVVDDVWDVCYADTAPFPTN